MLGGQNQALNPKNPIMIVLVIFVLLMTFVLLNPTMAQINNVQKQKTETLFKILENNNQSILLVFSRFETQNISVPQTAMTAYTEGLTKAKNAVTLWNQENYDEASIETVAAMQKFEETLKLLETNSPVQPTITEKNAEEIIFLKANIIRIIGQIERLENLTIKATTVGYETLGIENSLSEIKHHVNIATTELNSGNLKNAIEEVTIAKTLLNALKDPFARLTNYVTELNTALYLEKAEIRVSAVKVNITLSTTLSPEVKEEAINALNKSELNLSNARDFLYVNNVDDAIEELKEAKKWEESSRAIAALTATSTSVVPTNDSIFQTDESLTTNEITASK